MRTSLKCNFLKKGTHFDGYITSSIYRIKQIYSYIIGGPQDYAHVVICKDSGDSEYSVFISNIYYINSKRIHYRISKGKRQQKSGKI